MTVAEPFAIETLRFQTENECKEYVMNPENISTLTIEVIAHAGFNDRVTQIACMPKTHKNKKKFTINEKEV